MNKQTEQNFKSVLVNSKVERASSSLKMFAVQLDGANSILLEAVDDEGDFRIDMKLVSDKSELPLLEEAVCTVDWSWIENSKIDEILCEESQVKLMLNPAGPLVIGLGAWEGKPFLSFRPFRPAK